MIQDLITAIVAFFNVQLQFLNLIIKRIVVEALDKGTCDDVARSSAGLAKLGHRGHEDVRHVLVFAK